MRHRDMPPANQARFGCTRLIGEAEFGGLWQILDGFVQSTLNRLSEAQPGRLKRCRSARDASA